MRACTRQVFEMVMMAEPGVSLLDEEGRTVLKIAGSARVETAVLLRESLAQRPPDREVAIDWSEAEHVDASVLQVLLALRRSLVERGLSFIVDKDNLKVREYLKLAGLSDCFPLRANLSGTPPSEDANA